MNRQVQRRIVAVLDALQVEVDALKHLQAETAAELEAALFAAYGFSAKKDLLAQLLALNQQAAAKIEKGESATAPGVPRNSPNAKKLVPEDCIRPLVRA